MGADGREKSDALVRAHPCHPWFNIPLPVAGGMKDQMPLRRGASAARQIQGMHDGEVDYCGGNRKYD
jgi:hypothetical protein